MGSVAERGLFSATLSSPYAHYLSGLGSAPDAPTRDAVTYSQPLVVDKQQFDYRHLMPAWSAMSPGKSALPPPDPREFMTPAQRETFANFLTAKQDVETQRAAATALANAEREQVAAQAENSAMDANPEYQAMLRWFQNERPDQSPMLPPPKPPPIVETQQPPRDADAIPPADPPAVEISNERLPRGEDAVLLPRPGTGFNIAAAAARPIAINSVERGSRKSRAWAGF
jgi:hypothetical protein